MSVPGQPLSLKTWTDFLCLCTLAPTSGKEKKKDNNTYHIWFGEELNEVSELVSSITSGIDLSRAMGPLFPIA